MEPSKNQQAIFDEFSKDTARIAVNACPGAGKTTTIVETVTRCIEKLSYFDTISTCFNTDIRKVMESKLPRGVNVENFHRTGKVIVEKGLGVRSHQKWVDKYKYQNIVKDICKENGIDPDSKENYETLTMAVRAVNFTQLTLTNPKSPSEFAAMCDLNEIKGDLNLLSQITQVALNEGVAMAKYGTSIDFNDMVWLPHVLKLPRAKYSNVLIDEGQDLSPVQRELVLSLTMNDSKILFVGDPRQAIYAFAGAAADSFSLCKERIGAKELPLSVCYRCARLIVEEASKIYPGVMEAAPNAKDGIFESMKYSAIYAKVDPAKEDLILSRTTAPLVRLAFDLMSKQIPVAIKGRDIMTSLIMFMKTVMNSTSVEWNNFGTGLDTYRDEQLKLLDMRQNKGTEQKRDMLLDKVEAADVLWTAAMTENIPNICMFEKWLGQFFNDESSRCVVLSTIHKAKGTEADRVFILDPDSMPHKSAKTAVALEQEHNLQWVALTRAKNEMYYVDPRRVF